MLCTTTTSQPTPFRTIAVLQNQHRDARAARRRCRPTNHNQQEDESRGIGGTKAGGFKLDPVHADGAGTGAEAEAKTEAERGGGEKTNKQKKGRRERDLNPYRSVSRVRCGGTMEDGVIPCGKKVT